MERVVGVGEYIVTDQVGDSLKTYALASCIGIVIYCPMSKVLGMAHILLPNSEINPSLSEISPAYFADTGIKAMVNKMCYEYGCKKELMHVSIYGGAESMSKRDIFNIGSRNIEAVTKNLADFGLKINYQHIRDRYSRTIDTDVATGNTKLALQSMRL